MLRWIWIGPALLLAVIGLAGCGQKAPLYLPGHNPHPPKPLLSPPKKPAAAPADRGPSAPTTHTTP